MGRAQGQGEERRGSINSRAQSLMASFIYRGHSFLYSFQTPVEANFGPGLHPD